MKYTSRGNSEDERGVEIQIKAFLRGHLIMYSIQYIFERGEIIFVQPVFVVHGC